MLKITTLSIALAMAAAFSMPSQGGEPSCGGDPSCGACPCGTCCPQCGCHEGLVPVCHQYWEKKKVTEYLLQVRLQGNLPAGPLRRSATAACSASIAAARMLRLPGQVAAAKKVAAAKMANAAIAAIAKFTRS